MQKLINTKELSKLVLNINSDPEVKEQTFVEYGTNGVKDKIGSVIMTSNAVSTLVEVITKNTTNIDMVVEQLSKKDPLASRILHHMRGARWAKGIEIMRYFNEVSVEQFRDSLMFLVDGQYLYELSGDVYVLAPEDMPGLSKHNPLSRLYENDKYKQVSKAQYERFSTGAKKNYYARNHIFENAMKVTEFTYEEYKTLALDYLSGTASLLDMTDFFALIRSTQNTYNTWSVHYIDLVTAIEVRKQDLSLAASAVSHLREQGFVDKVSEYCLVVTEQNILNIREKYRNKTTMASRILEYCRRIGTDAETKGLFRFLCCALVPSSSRDALALVGDTVIDMYSLKKTLFSPNLPAMQMMMRSYVSNESMAAMIPQEIKSMYPSALSNHTYGTIVEAVIGAIYLTIPGVVHYEMYDNMCNGRHWAADIDLEVFNKLDFDTLYDRKIFNR